MQQINDQKKQNKSRTSSVLIYALFGVITILGTIRILIANQMVGASEKMRSLDSQIQKLQSENEVLSEDLRQKQSLVAVQTKVNHLGFTKTSTYSFVKPSDSVAFGIQLNSTP